MPRVVRKVEAGAAIEALVREFSGRLEALVRGMVAEQLGRAVAEELKARGSATPVAGKTARAQRMCPVPGCTKPAAGPKYRWRCRDHKEVSTEAIELERQKAKLVKRLPPAPGPKARREPPPLDCRYPNCGVKSRGPRYEFFCGEHYRELNADQRRFYAEQWKAARAQKAAAPPASPVVPSVIVRKAAAEKVEAPPAAVEPALEAAAAEAAPPSDAT